MDLQKLTTQMQRQGMRRLLVISGDAQWCQHQAEQWQAQLAGDWLWVGEAAQQQPHCAPGALRNLLGQEFRHALFDARKGFHAEAFAALAGTLLAGSWLLLLVPPWQAWSAAIDRDSLRWNDAAEAIATPNFVAHLQQQLLSDKRVAILRQDAPLRLQPLPAAADWQPEGQQQQQRLLQQLLTAPPGVSVLTAPRGRGKSALAGMLAQRWPGKCWVTAPAKVSTDVLAQFAGEAFRFYAPDTLLAACASQPPAQVDWLLIDEAAAIPAPILQRLIRYFPRVLLTTTVQGYEGTGRGFLLKFCAALPQAQFFTLDQPLRWALNDPLESFVERSLLFDEGGSFSSSGEVHFQRAEQSDWLARPASLTALYQLLTSAHYRTSPLDLRRMMDAQGMHFVAAYCQQQVCAALWLVDEGGLSAELASAVWAGARRPRGNLVAQSLAAHSGFPEAAQLRSRRISRIAITPARRRCGIGRQLIAQCVAGAAGLDFLSVSFGYTDELWQFWQACGFQLVRIGTQREASSGCYSAMALLPVSAAGRDLTQRAVKRLARDYYWLQQQLDQSLAIVCDLQQEFNHADGQEVAGFAFAHRPFEAAMPALGRLLARSSLALPALRGAITRQLSVGELCRSLGLAGRKALLQRWRQEARLALADFDPCGAISKQVSEYFPLPDGRGK
ncbi:GNAT family N-acetyltransferase [Erwiniaceae bacterium BAC15a-03b]|uniref:tRNA(Met) cytidine acetyltransferase TmcA n=1 Tax=Winslowiella arboricola TaxID=2978220 RepID=A0A9J6PNN0_9GAMM|nr:GNAT family N-acetyltransferase [Winslowiella arboricola]MCU5774025.1 GNAT family N-acetyltransferase [Winslowiella arboricola]MCU5777248.1 GNAT family N-acetyltransferase [Winslowiella arboricola]